MILSFPAIRRARWKHIDPTRPVRILREHIDPANALRAGFRLMALGWMLVIACSAASLELEFLGYRSASNAVMQFSCVAHLLILAGKLACLFYPVGRRLLCAHLLLYFSSPFLMLALGEKGSLSGWALSFAVLIAYLTRLAQNLELAGILRRLRVSMGLLLLAYVPGATLVVGLSCKPAVAATWIGFGCAGIVYASCLLSLARALPKSGHRLRPLVLLMDLACGLRRSLVVCFSYR